MTRTGTVKLFYKDELIAFSDYAGPQSRIKIIDAWRSVYGKKFNECAIQYRPDIVDRDKRINNTSKRLVDRQVVGV